ncbi:uncharacterized protein LOC110726112 isoform X1 [Chenopodium quinoa]|uniref:uncharacterized protein LOC110726112 isoform X1 n=1 Tax=Chenopodium quinoa TaxID=63459 RepID=UPI000B76C9ED|nr:uncharacterized protein LOC110726112 isoform X1 [Chenopodium quinoa]
MRGRRHAMSWRKVAQSSQGLAAHGLLFTFTLLLVLKLDHPSSFSWWTVFLPIWLFHAVVARGRFSLPAPSVPHDRHWAPCHAVVAAPLIIAFELLLCVYLESLSVNGAAAVSLKIVFFPLLAFETIILIDNFRMCRALMPVDDESLNDDAIWETLPHFWVAISMVFFLAATFFTALKISGFDEKGNQVKDKKSPGDIGSLGWWDLFINFGIAECFAFLVCTKWSNPMIHTNSCPMENTASVCPDQDQNQESLCGLPDIGGHFMKIPIIAFQVLLCMRLEGTPSGAKNIPFPVLFSPLFLLQGVGVLFAMSRLVEKIYLLLRSDAGQGPYLNLSAKLGDCLAFMHHGSRLIGWWSIDEGSHEERAKLLLEGASRYNTFCQFPPEIVKKMPKKDLAEEVWKLQAALVQQTEITKNSQQEYERLQNDKVLCRICFEGDISIVLLPCRHRILCSVCSDKCKRCPVCRVIVDDRLIVYDV